MPIGLKLISVALAIVGVLSGALTIVAMLAEGAFFESLSRSAIFLPIFVLTNIITPAGMVAGSIGLWRRATWAWWTCALVLTFELSSKVALAFLDPSALLGTQPVEQNFFSILALVALVYLFTPNIFRAFHGQKLKRRKVAALLTITAFALAGMLMWQKNRSDEVLRTNITFEADTQESRASQLTSYE